jgi:hypothetical protein
MFQSMSMNRVAPVAVRGRTAVPARAAGFRMTTSATARVDACNKKSIIVSPSILSANFAKLGEQARRRGGAGGRAGGRAAGVHAAPRCGSRGVAHTRPTLALSFVAVRPLSRRCRRG